MKVPDLSSRQDYKDLKIFDITLFFRTDQASTAIMPLHSTRNNLHICLCCTFHPSSCQTASRSKRRRISVALVRLPYRIPSKRHISSRCNVFFSSYYFLGYNMWHHTVVSMALPHQNTLGKLSKSSECIETFSFSHLLCSIHHHILVGGHHIRHSLRTWYCTDPF